MTGVPAQTGPAICPFAVVAPVTATPALPIVTGPLSVTLNSPCWKAAAVGHLMPENQAEESGAVPEGVDAVTVAQSGTWSTQAVRFVAVVSATR